MRVLICSETRPLLQAYHDEELPVSDQIAIGAHLEWCSECADEFAELRLMRGLIRAGAQGHTRLDPTYSGPPRRHLVAQRQLSDGTHQDADRAPQP